MKTVFGKYIILQIPGWLIAVIVLWEAHQWFALSPWIAGGILLALVVKDFVLYPFVRTAYESNAKTGVEQLIGIRGVAQKELDPRGQVRIRGELWRAEILPDAHPIARGEQVRVLRVRGVTLIVAADPGLPLNNRYPDPEE